ncbi:MAG: C40 family peptidase, partial [Oscillospiraceae bacterium]|nr:C40 family peptidase [Oscillospiraceae bacterium]
ATPTPAPSASPAPTAEPSPAPTATATHVPAPAATPAPTATPSSSPIPTVAATASPIPLPSFTPTPTFTPYPESLMAPLPEGRVYWTPPPTPVPTPTPVVTAPPTPVPVNPQGQDIADYAMQFEGYNYLYAGKDPETGFDCSGLVWYVYRHFGIELNRTAAGQSLNGEHVEPDQLQPGDILCFYNWGSGVGHSGIALGGDWYIHAMDAAHGVVISALSDRTDRIEIRRVFE